MVAYLCPLCASYFSIKYVDMQDKYVDMQESYVNMQHNYVDMQDNCNQIGIIQNLKNSQISPTCDIQDARCYVATSNDTTSTNDIMLH